LGRPSKASLGKYTKAKNAPPGNLFWLLGTPKKCPSQNVKKGKFGNPLGKTIKN